MRRRSGPKRSDFEQRVNCSRRRARLRSNAGAQCTASSSRFSCTALPDGGRMLSYTPVTELVRHTDDPAHAEYYRLMRKNRLRNPAGDLRAAE